MRRREQLHTMIVSEPICILNMNTLYGSLQHVYIRDAAARAAAHDDCERPYVYKPWCGALPQINVG